MGQYLYPALLIVSIVAFILVLYKTHTKWLITLVVRGLCSVFLILITNVVLSSFGLNIKVGINVISIVSSAILGIPGIVLLYGVSFINFYQL